jgi:hypothetical protein
MFRTITRKETGSPWKKTNDSRERVVYVSPKYSSMRDPTKRPDISGVGGFDVTCAGLATGTSRTTVINMAMILISHLTTNVSLSTWR